VDDICDVNGNNCVCSCILFCDMNVKSLDILFQMDEANVKYGVDFMCCIHEASGEIASFGTRRAMEFVSPDLQRKFATHFIGCCCYILCCKV